jgi:hypothetical protein
MLTGSSSTTAFIPKPPQGNAAIDSQLISVLTIQAGSLRQAFRSVDPEKKGGAAIDALMESVLNACFFSVLEDPHCKQEVKARWKQALRAFLKKADPADTGFVEFGRLTRLIRSSRGSNGDDVVEDVSSRFRGVQVSNTRLKRRLDSHRALADMPASARTSNILGDTRVSVPWGVIGDESRMDHMMATIQSERMQRLKATLQAHATGDTANQLTRQQFIKALRQFDPLIHDAEILEYFRNLSIGQSGRPRTSVSVSKFIQRYGQNVLSPPALRTSAEFTLQWQPRRPK